MSEMFEAVMLESIVFIGVLTAGLVWYAHVLAKREEQETAVRRATTIVRSADTSDPDAHLGHCGAE
jgi:hypothetical protein